MGVLSKYHRFREAGEQANVNNVERFGEPKRSLFTSTKFFTVHHHIDITDADENVVYQANSKFLTIHDKTYVTDAQGNQIAYIWKKIFTLHERHFVEMAGGTNFQISNELWHIVKDVTNIEELGWQLRGNIVGLNFELYDDEGGIIATISQKMISLHDKYCIDIYQPEHEKTCVAIMITLQHMIKDREAASAAAGGSSGAIFGSSRSSSN